MKRGSSPVKVRRWTERLARFKRSGQTVAQFCREEGVSQPSFYQWRKKLALPAAHPRRQPALAGRARNSSISQRMSPAERSPSFPFLPVQLLAGAEGAVCLTVRLPGGVELAMTDHLPLAEMVVGKLLEQVGAKMVGQSC